MAKLGISTGTIPNDNTGDSLIVGAIKINSNFDEIYTYLGAGSTDVLSTPIWNKTDVGISTLRNVGVGTTNPTSALTVSGDAVITGVITASVFSGSISNAIYSQNSGVSTYSSISGVSTSSTKVSIGETNLGSNSIVLTSGATLGINSLYIDSGLTYNAATNTLTASTFSGNSTYAVNAGVATNVIGGIASVTSLNVSGISTLGNTVIGGGTTELIVNGDARITGILTIGTTFTNQLSVSGVATATTLNDGIGNVRALPQNSVGVAYTLAITDVGKHVAITTGGVTVPPSIFSIGDNVTIFNNSDYNQMITPGSGVTLRRAGVGDTGARGLNGYGLATILCINVDSFVISGAGLT
jgi:hypothetical protein